MKKGDEAILCWVARPLFHVPPTAGDFGDNLRIRPGRLRGAELHRHPLTKLTVEGGSYASRVTHDRAIYIHLFRYPFCGRNRRRRRNVWMSLSYMILEIGKLRKGALTVLARIWLLTRVGSTNMSLHATLLRKEFAAVLALILRAMRISMIDDETLFGD